MSYAPDTTIRSLALRGVRELGFDTLKVIRSLKLSVESNNGTVTLPDDYVDWTKVVSWVVTGWCTFLVRIRT